MPLSERELMLLHISNIDLPGFELVPTAKRLVKDLFAKLKYDPVKPDKVVDAIWEIQISRVEVALALSRVQGKFLLKKVRAGLFFGDLLTCVSVVDTTDVMLQEIFDVISTLPWSSYYQVFPHKKKWTYDDVLELPIVQDHMDEMTKLEVEKIRGLLNNCW
jgi:hypothetical protein